MYRIPSFLVTVIASWKVLVSCAHSIPFSGFIKMDLFPSISRRISISPQQWLSVTYGSFPFKPISLLLMMWIRSLPVPTSTRRVGRNISRFLALTARQRSCWPHCCSHFWIWGRAPSAVTLVVGPRWLAIWIVSAVNVSFKPLRIDVTKAVGGLVYLF